MEKKTTYAKGIYFNKLKPDTPESVKKWKKGSVAMHIENLIGYLNSIKEVATEKGYVYHDFVMNEKDGETFFSFKLNDWKPAKEDFKKGAESLDSFAKDLSDTGADALKKKLANQDSGIEYPVNENPGDLPF